MNEFRIRTSVIWACLTVVFVLVLYPLSAGPMLWLVSNKYLPNTIDRVLYAPLEAIIDQCPSSVRDEYFSYQLWWLAL